MPIYEYRCNACGHQFEATQRMSDAPLTDCVVCGGEVSRVLFAPAIHFKGTGFHNTDYGTRRRPVGGDDTAGGGSDGAKDGAKKEPAAPAAASSEGAKKTVGLDKV